MNTENVSNTESLFIGKVQALVGAVQFDKNFFITNVQEQGFDELIQRIKRDVWDRYPTNDAVFKSAIIRRWVELFTIVQNRCAAIHGWPVIKAFQITEARPNLIAVHLDLLQSIQTVETIRVNWHLPDLMPPKINPNAPELTKNSIQVKIKSEFERDYIHLEPDQWYDVKAVILDKVMLSNNELYLKRKFDVRFAE